jgi:hypothetical protein
MPPVLRTIALLTLLAAPASARELPNVFTAPVPYRDPVNDFALSYPAGWRLAQGDRAVCFYAQGKRPGEAMFITRPVPTSKDFNTLYTELKGHNKGAEMTALVLGGVQVARMDLNATSGGKKYHARTYALVSKGRQFNLTLRCLLADYPKDVAAFNQVQDSLKFPK